VREFYAARSNVKGPGDSDHDEHYFPDGVIFFFALSVLFWEVRGNLVRNKERD